MANSPRLRSTTRMRSAHRVQLVEQHVIKRNHPQFDKIDEAAFASKNLYNLGNYHIRQNFFEMGWAYKYETLYHILKDTEAYQSLPRKVSQQILKILCKNWKAYFEAKKTYFEDPSKFLGEPRIPKYKDKMDGRNVLPYTIQAISKRHLRSGYINPSGLSLMIKTKQRNVNQVRIVPKKTHYIVEVVYTVEIDPVPLNYSLVAGIDIGVNNLTAIASNKRGFVPLVVNGRPLKAINQFYNKRKAELQAQLKNDQYTSWRIERMNDKRTRRINHYLHTESRHIIDLLVAEGIGVLIIGKNNGWKQKINIGKGNNQNFVQIPHARFIEMLKYKSELVGIHVIITEESHTSKCSFLDLESIEHHEGYQGRRIKRGMFRSSDGRKINADINAAYNIIRKVIPDAFSKGIEGVVVHPVPFLLAA